MQSLQCLKRRRFELLFCCLAFSLMLPTIGVAQNNDVKLPPPKLLQLKVIDSDGRPVEDVSIRLTSLVYADNSGLSISGQSSINAIGGEMVTDINGVISIKVPDALLGDLARFNLNAAHSDFAEFNQWLSVDPKGTTEITLARGVQIAVMAIDAETKAPIKDDLYAIAEQQESDSFIDWKLKNNGTLVSRPLNDSDCRIRLVQIKDGVATRFSDVIDVESVDTNRKLLRDVPIKAAIKLNGRLRDEVARPVTNGQALVCISWPNEAEQDKYGPAGHWLSHAPIDAEGNFEFSGLPPSDCVQVIAYCDGWFNQSATADLRMARFPGENKLLNIDDNILPALFVMDGAAEPLVVSMQPTVDATIRFLDAKERPIANAEIRVQRSQRFFAASWSSREFGQQWNTALQLQACRRGEDYTPAPGPVFEGRTDESGLVQFKNLPGRKLLAHIIGRNFQDNRTWKQFEINGANEATVVDD